MTLTKIRELNEFVHKKPPLGILISYLSHSISLTGSKIGITYGALYDGHIVVCEYAFGFANDQKFIGLTHDLFDERPPAIALRTNKIIYGVREDLLSIPDIPKSDENLYPYFLVIPVAMNRFYGFAISEQDRELSGQKDYFDTIKSVLEIYHSINKGMDGDVGLAELTGRQRQVLEMIRNNSKNGDIAEKLGYSESLIRQETVAIYRKMGVHGRKDLQLKHHSES